MSLPEMQVGVRGIPGLKSEPRGTLVLWSVQFPETRVTRLLRLGEEGEVGVEDFVEAFGVAG